MLSTTYGPHCSRPALYRGVRFRSRLEGRWAIFFAELGIGWQFEPEKFSLPSGIYVPDFRVEWPSGLALWVEVKPKLSVVGDRDRARYAEFSANGRALVLAHGLPRAELFSMADALDRPGGVLLAPDGPVYLRDLPPESGLADINRAARAAQFARFKA
jgi:hypothetical protein